MDMPKESQHLISKNLTFKVNLKHEIEKITDGYGCDVYFEVTGNPISVQQGLDILTRQGRFICMSIFKKDVPADWSLIGNYVSSSPNIFTKNK